MNLLIVGNGFIRHHPPNEYFCHHHTVDLLRGIARLGHTVTYATPIHQIPEEAGLNNAKMPLDEIAILPLGRWAEGLPRVLGAIHRADLLYLFFPGTWTRIVGRVCRWIGKPYGVYVRGQRFSHRGADSRLLANASFICAETGLSTRVRPHHPGVVTVAPMLDMTERDARTREFQNCETKPIRLLFVGRLEEAKGVPELIAAAQLLRERCIPFELRLVGGGPLHAPLTEWLASQVPAAATLVGLVREPKALMLHYEWADVLVLPTHHEGFPRVLFEAMLKSCVILTTLVGGIPAIMKNDQNCLALTPKNPQVIADAVQRIASDPTLRQALSEAGRQTVLSVLATHPSHLTAVKEAIDASA